MAERNIRWVLGEGMVDFWWDRWLFDEPLATYLGVEQPTHFLVAEFYEGDVWNEDKLL